jgi:hypothetical protein
MPRRQRQGRHGSTAAPEHLCRRVANRSEHAPHVVGDEVRLGILLAILDSAAPEASGIVRYDRMVTGESGARAAKPELSMGWAISMSTGPEPCTS